MRQSVLTRATYSLVSSATDLKPSSLDADVLNTGVHFKAKFVGSLEVPRPTNRVEIIAAMRNIRYEYKEKGVKKTKIDLCISTSNLMVTKRSNKRLWKKRPSFEDSVKVLMQHPIYRIFYVSHDSQDLQIFSYIACDNNNFFKCFVFKSSTNSGAIHIVRTIGRVFDICHSLNQQHHQLQQLALTDAENDKTDEEQTYSELPAKPDDPGDDGGVIPSVAMAATTNPAGDGIRDDETVTDGNPLMLALRQQLRLEMIKTQHLQAELQLSRTQMKAETTARISLEQQVEQLINQNQRLLSYISELIYNNKLSLTASTSDCLIDLDISPSDLMSAAAAGKLNGSIGLSPDSGHQGDMLSPTETGFLTPSWFPGPPARHDVGYSQVNSSASMQGNQSRDPGGNVSSVSILESTAATTGESFKIGLDSISRMFSDNSLFADFNTCSYLSNCSANN